jgi:hypothetical protein
MEERMKKAFNDTCEELKKLNKQNFKHVLEKDGIIVDELPPPPKPIGTFRSRGRVQNYSAEQVVKLLTDADMVTKLSVSIIKCEILESYDNGKMNVMYHEHKSHGFGIAQRDFVILNSSRQEEDGTYMIVNCSVEHEKVPERKGILRGNLRCSGYFIKPLEQGCDVTYLIQTDPKGWLPGWLVKLGMRTLPWNYQRIDEILSGNAQDVVLPPVNKNDHE